MNGKLWSIPILLLGGLLIGVSSSPSTERQLAAALPSPGNGEVCDCDACDCLHCDCLTRDGAATETIPADLVVGLPPDVLHSVGLPDAAPASDPQPAQRTAPQPQVVPVSHPAATAVAPAAAGHWETRSAGRRGRRSYLVWVPAAGAAGSCAAPTCANGACRLPATSGASCAAGGCSAPTAGGGGTGGPVRRLFAPLRRVFGGRCAGCR